MLKSHIVAVVAFLAVALLAPAAHASHMRPLEPVVPAEIKVPPGNKAFLVGHALGVQVYECASGTAGFEWRFVEPRAKLFDRFGKLIITHFAGPTWQARDGSRVVGRLERSVTVNRRSIPWLLLSRASSSAGPADGDQLVDTTFIHRISTNGGLAPAVAFCNKLTLGARVESPYTADYVFYKATN
jgi:hypothetical protein